MISIPPVFFFAQHFQYDWSCHVYQSPDTRKMKMNTEDLFICEHIEHIEKQIFIQHARANEKRKCYLSIFDIRTIYIYDFQEEWSDERKRRKQKKNDEDEDES